MKVSGVRSCVYIICKLVRASSGKKIGWSEVGKNRKFFIMIKIFMTAVIVDGLVLKRAYMYKSYTFNI